MLFTNPFRPGAGHPPPYLAGRTAEQEEIRRLLKQRVVNENAILTGLRGVGKTVLLDTFQPIAVAAGWLWAGTDLSESASLTEERLATRIIADISRVTSAMVVKEIRQYELGFTSAERIIRQPLSYEILQAHYASAPGLVSDKLKSVLEFVWSVMPRGVISGIVFAYDEAQNLADHAAKNEYPLSLLLEVFQSLQRKQYPFFLILSGLPTLFPKLVDSRTYAERMFHVMFLKQLSATAAREAVVRPIIDQQCPIKFSEAVVDRVVEISGCYPYFIQFICKEVYDVWISKLTRGEVPSVPEADIIRKLDNDFFSGRWANATDRQRALLQVISTLDKCDNEFTVSEVVLASRETLEKPFTPSHVNQMLVSLADSGLVYKNRYGKYSLAVPLLAQFIRRQAAEAQAAALLNQEVQFPNEEGPQLPTE
jgi:hypothetical protein